MTEYVFKAADSESAMDKAVRELGEDAMILSIRRVGNLTEVRAIKQTVAAVTARPPEPKPRRRFEEPFAKGVSAEPLDLEQALRSVRNRRDHDTDMEDMRQESYASDGRWPQPYSEVARSRPLQTSALEIDPYESTQLTQMLDTRALTQETSHTDLMRRVPGDPPSALLHSEQMFQRSDASDPAISASSEDTFRADGRFGGLPDTDPPLPVAPWTPGRSETHTPYQSIGTSGYDPSPLQRPNYTHSISGSEKYGSGPTAIVPTVATSERIMRHGFPGDIARACAIAPDLHAPKAQLDHACKLLAERLAWPDETSPLHEGGMLFLFGPPGAGKTTVAAQIAFERIQTYGIRPNLTKLSRESFVDDRRLQHYALLLDTMYTEALWHQPQSYSASDILDCDLCDPEQVQEAYDLICLNNEATDVTPVMIMPGTWSVLAIKHYCQAFKDLSPATILTHMNIGGIGIGGLATLSSENARLVAASETQMITDGLAPVDQPSIEQFLQDTFTYTDIEFGPDL